MPVTIDGNNTPTAGGVGYGDGSELAFTAAGTSGQVLKSNGTSAPSWEAMATYLPVTTYSGSVTNVGLQTNYLPVLTNAGATVNVSVY